MKKDVISVLQKRNTNKIAVLEKTCDDAVSVFRQTIEKLESASENYQNLQSNIDEEINELIKAKSKVVNKISDLSKITNKFKEFLS